MNIEEIESTIKAFQNEIVKLQQEVEKLKKKENKRWRAELGENYYYIDYDLKVFLDTDNYCGVDTIKYNNHNYFKTEEEAQAVADNIKTHIELIELAEELNTEPIDWENEKQNKYCIKYSYDDKEINTGSYSWSKNANIIYCTNSNFKDEAIKRIGEERLISYLKGV